MANRYVNLVGSNKIKDEYTKINTGFDKVEEEIDAHVGAGGNAHATATTSSAGFMSAADKQKLDGIETGAQVNQNAFAKVNGVEADDPSDELTIEGGTGIAVTQNPLEKKVIITATGEAIPGPHGSAHMEFGADPIPLATTTEGGLMSASDKAKLDGATSAATPNRIVMRDGNGNISIGNATSDAHALNRITADGRYALESTHKLKTYTSLEDIGLTSADFDGLTTQEEYAEKIVLAMEENSMLQLNILSNNSPIPNGDNFYPTTTGTTSKNGILLVRKASNARTEFEYSFGNSSVIGGATNDKHHAVFVEGIVPPLRRWSGWSRYAWLETIEYDLPLAAGFTDYGTLDGSMPSKIYKVGNIVVVSIALTKNSGNFTFGEIMATIPAGLRPPIRLYVPLYTVLASNPSSTGGVTDKGFARVQIQSNGNVMFYETLVTNVNRLFGIATYPLI